MFVLGCPSWCRKVVDTRSSAAVVPAAPLEVLPEAALPSPMPEEPLPEAEQPSEDVVVPAEQPQRDGSEQPAPMLPEINIDIGSMVGGILEALEQHGEAPSGQPPKVRLDDKNDINDVSQEQEQLGGAGGSLGDRESEQLKAGERSGKALSSKASRSWGPLKRLMLLRRLATPSSLPGGKKDVGTKDLHDAETVTQAALLVGADRGTGKGGDSRELQTTSSSGSWNNSAELGEKQMLMDESINILDVMQEAEFSQSRSMAALDEKMRLQARQERNMERQRAARQERQKRLQSGVLNIFGELKGQEDPEKESRDKEAPEMGLSKKKERRNGGGRRGRSGSSERSGSSPPPDGLANMSMARRNRRGVVMQDPSKQMQPHLRESFYQVDSPGYQPYTGQPGGGVKKVGIHRPSAPAPKAKNRPFPGFEEGPILTTPAEKKKAREWRIKKRTAEAGAVDFRRREKKNLPFPRDAILAKHAANTVLSAQNLGRKNLRDLPPPQLEFTEYELEMAGYKLTRPSTTEDENSIDRLPTMLSTDRQLAAEGGISIEFPSVSGDQATDGDQTLMGTQQSIDPLGDTADVVLSSNAVAQYLEANEPTQENNWGIEPGTRGARRDIAIPKPNNDPNQHPEPSSLTTLNTTMRSGSREFFRKKSAKDVHMDLVKGSQAIRPWSPLPKSDIEQNKAIQLQKDDQGACLYNPATHLEDRFVPSFQFPHPVIHGEYNAFDQRLPALLHQQQSQKQDLEQHEFLLLPMARLLPPMRKDRNIPAKPPKRLRLFPPKGVLAMLNKRKNRGENHPLQIYDDALRAIENRARLLISKAKSDFHKNIRRAKEIWLGRAVIPHACRRQKLKKIAVKRSEKKKRQFLAVKPVIKAMEVEKPKLGLGKARSRFQGAFKKITGKEPPKEGSFGQGLGAAGKGKKSIFISAFTERPDSDEEPIEDAIVEEDKRLELDRMGTVDASLLTSLLSPRYNAHTVTTVIRPAVGNLPAVAHNWPLQKESSLILTSSTLFHRDLSLKSPWYGGGMSRVVSVEKPPPGSGGGENGNGKEGGSGSPGESSGKPPDSTAGGDGEEEAKKEPVINWIQDPHHGVSYATNYQSDWRRIFDCFYPVDVTKKPRKNPVLQRKEDTVSTKEMFSEVMSAVLRAFHLHPLADNKQVHLQVKELVEFRAAAARNQLSKIFKKQVKQKPTRWTKETFGTTMQMFAQTETPDTFERAQLSPEWYTGPLDKQASLTSAGAVRRVLTRQLDYHVTCTEEFIESFRQRFPPLDDEMKELQEMGLENSKPKFCETDHFLDRFQALRANHGFSNNELDGVCYWFLKHPFCAESVRRFLLRWGYGCDFEVMWEAARCVIPGIKRGKDTRENGVAPWNSRNHAGSRGSDQNANGNASTMESTSAPGSPSKGSPTGSQMLSSVTKSGREKKKTPSESSTRQFNPFESVGETSSSSEAADEWHLPRDAKLCIPQIAYVLQCCIAAHERKVRKVYEECVKEDQRQLMANNKGGPVEDLPKLSDTKFDEDFPRLRYAPIGSETVLSLLPFTVYQPLTQPVPAIYSQNALRKFVRQMIQSHGFSTSFLMLARNCFYRIVDRKPDAVDLSEQFSLPEALNLDADVTFDRWNSKGGREMNPASGSLDHSSRDQLLRSSEAALSRSQKSSSPNLTLHNLPFLSDYVVRENKGAMRVKSSYEQRSRDTSGEKQGQGPQDLAFWDGQHYIHPRFFYWWLQKMGFNSCSVYDLTFLHKKPEPMDLYDCLEILRPLLENERFMISQLFVLHVITPPRPLKTFISGPKQFDAWDAPNGHFLLTVDEARDMAAQGHDPHKVEVLTGLRDDGKSRIDLDVLWQMCLSLTAFGRERIEDAPEEFQLDFVNASIESTIDAGEKTHDGGAEIALNYANVSALAEEKRAVESKGTMLSSRSAATLMSRMSTISTRGKPKFVPGVQSREMLKMEFRTQDAAYLQRRRDEKQHELARLRKQLQEAKDRELEDFRKRYENERKWTAAVKSKRAEKDKDVINFRRNMQKEDQEMRREAEALLRQFEQAQQREQWLENASQYADVVAQ
eukprot:g4291.t1